MRDLLFFLTFNRLRCDYTIETRVKELQEKKLKLSEAVVAGSAVADKF